MPHLDESVGTTNPYLFKHITAIDGIEELTGIDFFPELPNQRQTAVEGVLITGPVEDKLKALRWDYAEWPKPDESEEELKFARLQDTRFESWLKRTTSDDDLPELIDKN